VSDDRLQEGIYSRRGERPPPCYRLLLLNFLPHTEPGQARPALEQIFTMLGDLRKGNVRDLGGQDDEQIAKAAGELGETDRMFAFGARLFDHKLHDPPLLAAPRPGYLVSLTDDGDPFPAVPWSSDRDRWGGEADIAIQLTGPSEAAVNRATVEIWKLLADEKLPLDVVASFAGFSRRDGRGWLDFHDGVSNIESSERIVAIQTGADPDWMAGGTYMAFLRFAVDLAAWRGLTRTQQELIVGRDKLTGQPVLDVRRGPGGEALPVTEATVPDEETSPAGTDFREPPEVADPIVKASHLQRANRNRASPWAPAGQRIYRQGYEFLERLDGDGITLGLNFVSFQADLGTLRRVLHLPGWLADVNFGGPAAPSPGDPPNVRLLSLLAGGLYCVPPGGTPFPGAELFDDPSSAPGAPAG
jgi:deferrochelatase/peroxidase EfeB